MNNDHVHSATAKVKNGQIKNRQYQFCFIFRETAKQNSHQYFRLYGIWRCYEHFLQIGGAKQFSAMCPFLQQFIQRPSSRTMLMLSANIQRLNTILVYSWCLCFLHTSMQKTRTPDIHQYRVASSLRRMVSWRHACSIESGIVFVSNMRHTLKMSRLKI